MVAVSGVSVRVGLCHGAEHVDWTKHVRYFFIAIQMFLANIVFGIIVDNFAELRDSRKEQEVRIERHLFYLWC